MRTRNYRLTVVGCVLSWFLLGLHVPPQLWCDLTDFSGGAVVVVLASHPYEEADYIRDHDDFLAFRGSVASA